MKYIELNLLHKKSIKPLDTHKQKLEWDDPDLLDILTFCKLPKRKHTIEDNNINSCHLSEIDSLLNSYDMFSTDKEVFIHNMANQVSIIKNKHPYWRGVNLDEINAHIKMSKFCLICGEGGIGKTFFVQCLEDKLENENIDHLCIYGKFLQSVNDIDVDEIVKIAQQKRFVFIVDAFNELSNDYQNSLFILLKQLKPLKGIQIIITYRTGRLSLQSESNLKEISEYLYRFSGVSYESVLDLFSRLGIKDVYKYEDILYSNNPMLLNILTDVLQRNALKIDELKSVSSITNILEAYIKNGKNKDLWEDTKEVVNWLYINNTRQIKKSDIISIIRKPLNYIDKMIQRDLLIEYERDNEVLYFFKLESLIDFLLTRSLFDEFDKNKLEESIQIIKEKIGKIYGIEKAVILALFDLLSPDYKTIKYILIETNLTDYFDYETLLKIKFEEKHIKHFLDNFKCYTPKELLLYFGGYVDKPFNCTNYLNDYYLNDDKKQIIELSQVLSGKYLKGRIKERLKNILYFVNYGNTKLIRLEEPFYFALWCCASSNKMIHDLSVKLLFDIIEKNPCYKNKLKHLFYKINDFYIKEAIIYVICSSASIDDDKSFLFSITKDRNFLHAKSIKRIAVALGNAYDYINWIKDNKYNFRPGEQISNHLDTLLSRVDLYEKYLLHFRYWGKGRIENNRQFLNVNKCDVQEWNTKVQNEFTCIKTGRCNGVFSLERNLNKYYNTNYMDNVLDNNSLLLSFEDLLKEVFDMYSVQYDVENILMDDFPNSLTRKIIIIAQEIFYGSLMCNYYSANFCSYYDEKNNIGYQLYDPFEYDEDINIVAPIPAYNEQIEQLNNRIIKQIITPKNNLSEWIRDTKLSQQNIFSIIHPVSKKDNQWVLLAGHILLNDGDFDSKTWEESYIVWCCTSQDYQILGCSDDRYLTIELEKYEENISNYSNCSDKSSLCKRIPSFNNDIVEDIFLVFPPADIIRRFNLHFSHTDMSWKNENEESIIKCNNLKASYYKDPIIGTVYMRKDYYDMYAAEHYLKYFVFTEKLIKSTEIVQKTAFNYEIVERKISKQFNHYLDNNFMSVSSNDSICNDCKYNFINESSNANDLIEFLKELRYTEDLLED